MMIGNKLSYLKTVFHNIYVLYELNSCTRNVHSLTVNALFVIFIYSSTLKKYSCSTVWHNYEWQCN
jgi:predicted membrane channel-forming protein YqfA (hemolysin III family)